MRLTIRLLLISLISSLIPLFVWAQDVPPTLLISFDGFRNDYPTKADVPNIRWIMGGVQAKALQPVFPSKTFTNHYTLATGLLPVHHGIISNTMFDPTMQKWFRMSDTNAVRDGRWWGGEPIWVTAVKQGQKSACYFWPGTEAEIGGIRPTYWKPYVHTTPYQERVEQVLKWLDLPAAMRPRILTLYLSDADDAGHRFGPDAPETKAAIVRLDSAIGLLLDGLRTRSLLDKVNLLIVSDHGMTAVDTMRVVYWDDTIDPKNVTWVEEGPNLTLNAPADSVGPMVERLNNLDTHLRAYAAGDLPGTFGYRNNPRIPSIIALAEDGWSILRRSNRNRYRPSFGNHGYDNQLPSMQAFFVARGPGFKLGVTVERLYALDVYELLCFITRLRPAKNDGSLERMLPVVK